MAKISLLLDEDVRPVLGEILRHRGYDVVHVLELERTGKTDTEQLAHAIGQQRAILTHNIKDFIILDREYRRNGKEHFGILLSDQVAMRELLRRALRFLGRRSAEEVKNNIFWLNEQS
jgi:predicted nuclease of predicted toxin-antitoxin system